MKARHRKSYDKFPTRNCTSNQNLSFLLSFSVELQKANLEAQNPSTPGGSSTGNSTNQSSTSGPSPLASAIPLAQLLSKPGALNALTSLSALGGLTDLLGGITGSSPPVQTTGVHLSLIHI